MLSRPSERQLIEFLIRADHEPLNGGLYRRGCPTSLQRRVHLGTGERLLRRCGAAMHRWCMIPPEMVDLYWPERPVCQGTTLATGMRAAGVYWLNPCRIAECTDVEPDPSGGGSSVRMRWETVRGHCLIGHESFRVGMELRTSNVFYEISSTACPIPWLRPWSRRVDQLRSEFQRLSCERFATLARRLSRLSREDLPVARLRDPADRISAARLG